MAKPGRPGAAKGGKGATKGSGGNNKRRLAGKGPTPKAEDRKKHKAFKLKQAEERKARALGINPLNLTWSSGVGATTEHFALDSLVQSLVEQRNAARAAKDFAKADRLRDIISAAGIKLEDAADQTHWSVD